MASEAARIISDAWLYLQGDGSYHRYSPFRSDSPTAEGQLATDRNALALSIDAAIQAAVQRERDECVKLCHELWAEGHLFSEASRMMSAIRNRKEKPDEA